MPDCAISAKQADGFQGDGFAARVGAGDDELAAIAFEFKRDRDDFGVLEFEVALEERVTGVVEDEARTLPGFARLGRPGAAVPT